MAIETEVTSRGQKSTSTLAGDIRLEEGRGRLVIYDPDTARELNVVDRTGYLFSDATDRRIKLGSHDDEVGFWISKPSEDVIDLLDS
jgi:hypothetical protein